MKRCGETLAPLWPGSRSARQRRRAFRPRSRLCSPSCARSRISQRSPGRGRLLVLDEPTPFLPRVGVDQLFALVRRIVAEGASVIFVSHDIDEVMEITDRATVLRDGALVGVLETRRATPRRLCRADRRARGQTVPCPCAGRRAGATRRAGRRACRAGPRADLVRGRQGRDRRPDGPDRLRLRPRLRARSMAPSARRRGGWLFDADSRRSNLRAIDPATRCAAGIVYPSRRPAARGRRRRLCRSPTTCCCRCSTRCARLRPRSQARWPDGARTGRALSTSSRTRRRCRCRRFRAATSRRR